jgi:DNA-binding XRE family transcriptional regulator
VIAVKASMTIQIVRYRSCVLLLAHTPEPVGRLETLVSEGRFNYYVGVGWKLPEVWPHPDGLVLPAGDVTETDGNSAEPFDNVRNSGECAMGHHADMNSPNVLDTQGPNLSNRSQNFLDVTLVPMGRESGGSKSPSAQRVKRVREYLGYSSQKEFSDFLGISRKRWNNVENGFPLSKDIANILCRKVPGLTLDYLYNGSLSGLPHAMAQALGNFAPPLRGTTSPVS